jgi:hypothetical protein
MKTAILKINSKISKIVPPRSHAKASGSQDLGARFVFMFNYYVS